MEEFKIDASEDPGAVGGAHRFVVVHTPSYPGDIRPILWRKSNGSTAWMTYRTIEGARSGRTRVLRADAHWDAARVGVFDKHVGALV